MCCRRVILGLLFAVLSTQTSPAQGQLRLIGDPQRDVQQTIQARRLLAADADLQEHNLGVIVRDRVATLWGPAPSAEVAFRAELCLRTMIELVEIRNELFVSDLIEPIRRRLKTDNAIQILPDWTTPPTQNERRPILQAPIPIKAPEATADKRPTLPELPPIPLPELGPPQIEPDVSGNRDQRLLEAVGTALQSNDRFRAVLFSVKEGRVSLKMTEPDTSILHEAAQAVSRLPNVAAVLVVEKTNSR
jgi:hypothetical protein